MNLPTGTARFRAPKTILGFFAILTAILISGGVCTVGILANVPAFQGYVAPVLVFVGTVFITTLVGVFVTAWKDPTILMLGQVSGEVYFEIHKQKLGDSASGEHAEKIAFPIESTVMTLGDQSEKQKGEMGNE